MSGAALKAMRLSAEMRTNLALMEKSPVVTGAHLKKARDDCALYLEETNLIYPPSMRSVGLFEGQPLPERKEALKVRDSVIEETKETLEFQELLATGGRKQIRANWIWRIGQECVEKSLEGWYGFFVTLTVDPKRVADSQSMWAENREFRKYIRRLAKVSARACGMPSAIKNGASDSDFVHHVGVIEHGKSREHHHMHLLIWMRDIPSYWKKCPNRSIRDPKFRTRKECIPMRTYWPHSADKLKPALYFRHEGDVWSRHGFCLPYDEKKQRVVKIHAPEKAGLYIAKYMDKEDKAWTHRVKATRNLGLTRLRKVLMQMHWKKIEALTWRPKTYSLNTLAMTIHTVPPGLLRLMAKQEDFCRKWARKALDFADLLQPSCDSFSLMLKSVRDGARPKRMPSKVFYEWVTEHLPDPPGYCEEKYKRAITSLGVHFAPVRHDTTEHLGIT